jgi:hypothetical protein
MTTTIPIQVGEERVQHAGTAAAPISKARLRMCVDSTTYWAVELPRYANRQQDKADRWALAAGVVGAITGLSAFPTLENTGLWGRVAPARTARCVAGSSTRTPRWRPVAAPTTPVAPSWRSSRP